MAAKFAGDGGRPQAAPTARNHLGLPDPVARRVPALGQPADPTFFRAIARGVRVKELVHCRHLLVANAARFYTAFEE